MARRQAHESGCGNESTEELAVNGRLSLYVTDDGAYS
jgi:hypothetical protein